MSVAAVRVAVIVPTIGRVSLAQTLEGLARQERPADELAVVEDREGRGAAWARNRGLERTTAELVACLDDDAVPPPSWLAGLVEIQGSFEADVVGGGYAETDPLLAEVEARRRRPVAPVVDATGIVGNGGNILYRRAMLEQCAVRAGQVWDETIRGAGEDIELMWRLRSAGARCVWTPVRVQHLRRVTVGSYLRHQYHRGASIAVLAARIRERPDLAPPQRSLLWGAPGASSTPLWGRLVRDKVLGPFCRSDFGTSRRFATFWVGQKAEGLGYLARRLDGVGKPLRHA